MLLSSDKIRSLDPLAFVKSWWRHEKETLSALTRYNVVTGNLRRHDAHVGGLVQDYNNCNIANALELPQSCTYPSIWLSVVITMTS